jgi:hypothetical protein
VFIYLLAPETNGHSPEDIRQSLRDHTFWPRDAARKGEQMQDVETGQSETRR